MAFRQKDKLKNYLYRCRLLVVSSRMSFFLATFALSTFLVICLTDLIVFSPELSVVNPKLKVGNKVYTEAKISKNNLDTDAQISKIAKQASTGLKDHMYTSFLEALRYTAGQDNVVFMSYVDEGARSMVFNFYLTSILRHNITNMLLLSSSESLCNDIHDMGMPCFVYASDPDSNKQSNFGSKDFIRKMNIRTFMILEALQAGYNVLHTDVDMYFFQNPLDSIKHHCNGCDIATLQDMENHNAGFLFIRNTSQSVSVYKEMKDIAENTNKNDQHALNIAIENGEKHNGLQAKKLPMEEFQCGRVFFKIGERKFAGDNPCPKCVVLHNNWITGMEPKIYRFKEMLMWMNDEDGYYTDTSRKYLTFAYHNSMIKGSSLRTVQIKALLDALAIGEVLNRTVILPRFSNNANVETFLLSRVNLAIFDKVFRNKYRESSFLSNPLVPSSVVKSRSGVILIKNDKIDQSAEGIPTVQRMLEPADTMNGATSGEILKWFGGSKESILQFHSLYGAFSKFDSTSEEQAFRDKCNQGF